MNILSLFDGMACGMLAMKWAGVQVDNYYAYEIDKYAVQTAQHNFPEIQELGDVFKEDYTKYEGNIDFLIGGSPCFTAGHLVLTNKGYVDIKDIKVGDMVLTHTGEYKAVVRTNKRIAKVCEVAAMGYPKFVTTEEHPFYTLKRRKATYQEHKQSKSYRTFDNKPEWTKAGELTNNHFVGMRICKEYNEESIDEEFAYILGRYVADGHLRNTKRKNRKNSYQYQVILSIGAKKVEQFKSRIKKRRFSCYPHSDSEYRCVFNSREMLEFIRSSGFGEGAINKNIPEFMFNQTPKIQQAFITGYIEGDGCFIPNGNKYSMSTVSPKLAFGLQRMITALWQTNVSVSLSSGSKPHAINGREIKAKYPCYTICAKTNLSKQAVAHIQDDIMWTQVKNVKTTDRINTVYNIEVTDNNSYTVNNCIVHNCTYWSIAQSPDKRETTSSGVGWDLFSQYVRALKETKPDFFIYENNKSMARAIYEAISDTFGFEPIMINSALVSAQNRQRYYWVGKRNEDGTYSKVDIEQPEDRGILLKDILDSGMDLTLKDKSFTQTATYNGAVPQNTLERHQRDMIAEPVAFSMVGDLTNRRVGTKDKAYCLGTNPSSDMSAKVIEPVNTTVDGKAQCLRATYYKDGIRNIAGNTVDRKTGIAEPVVYNVPHGFNKGGISENDKAPTLTTSGYRENHKIVEPVNTAKNNKAHTIKAQYSRSGIANFISNAGFNASAAAEPVNTTSDDKAYCLRATYYKSNIRDIAGNNIDRKTGVAEPVGVAQRGRYNGNGTEQHIEVRKDKKSNCLTTVQTDCMVGEPIRVCTIDYHQGSRIYSDEGKSVCLTASGGGLGGKTGLYAVPIEFEHDVPIKAVSCADGKTYDVYEVKNGLITIKGKTYPIKLSDGYYIIRKLTVSECKRLQTVPEWYEFPVSNSQAYKMLGNGWTVEVIIHLIKSALAGTIGGV